MNPDDAADGQAAGDRAADGQAADDPAADDPAADDPAAEDPAPDDPAPDDPAAYDADRTDDATDRAAGGLTHIDDTGRARMVDVGDKAVTRRRAVAEARVVMSPATAARVARGDLPKGDALPVVRLAGIQAAKVTPSLIPLCHHVALTSVDVEVVVDAGSGVATITATANALDRTGVEMEALTAASVASLCLYDLVKAVQKDVVVTDIRLLAKSGGRSGDWHAEPTD